MKSLCGCGRSFEDIKEHILTCAWFADAQEKVLALSKDERLTLSKLLEELRALKERTKWTPNSDA